MPENIPQIQSSYNLLNNIVLGLLIAAGIIGIAIALFSVLSSWKSEELIRAKDRQLEIDLKNKDAQIAAANDSANQAEKKAEGFRLDIAEANKRAAEANRLAEDEKLARVKIEEKLAPRRLTVEQQQDLAAQLKSFAGQKVNVYAYSGDPESLIFANIIIASLGEKGAGWDVAAAMETPLNRTVSGVLVELRTDADDNSTKAAVALVNALRKERVAVGGPHSGQTDRMISGKALDYRVPISITVGVKP